jgi:preprotein translocase subunit SecD
MKSVLYIFVAIFIFGILQPAFTKKAPQLNSIVIQATDNKVSTQQLELSAKIISGRLTDFGSEKFEVNILPEKGQIAIHSTNIQDRNIMERLLTQKGEMAFYETYDRNSLFGVLKGDAGLFSLLTETNASISHSKIGCTAQQNVKGVQTYLDKMGVVKDCKFAWDQSPDGENVCLYALKVIGIKGSLITGTDIESVEISQDNTSKSPVIFITLKQEVAKAWADATRRNINHAIAILLDDKVLAAPVVRSVMESGKCSITGNYTLSEAKYIVALGNNDELPLEFKIVN